MVAFNPRGDHFIPPPVPLGRWGLPLLIFLRFFLCIIAKKKWVGRVGNVWIKGVACCFSLVKLSLCNSKRKLSESRADSLWSRRVREQRNAPDRFQSEVFGRRVGAKAHKCVDQGRGLSVFFCSFSFAEPKEKQPSAERQSLRAGGWARWLWRARSPPPSAPLGLRQLAKEQYDEDRQGSLGVYPFHLPFGQRLLAKGSTRGSVEHGAVGECNCSSINGVGGSG